MKHVTRSSDTIPSEFLLEPAGDSSAGDSSIDALKMGLQYALEDMVQLELTAEQMLEEETLLVSAYLTDDMKHFWSDIKDGIVPWERLAANWLLNAADPTYVEWQRSHWWEAASDKNLPSDRNSPSAN